MLWFTTPYLRLLSYLNRIYISSRFQVNPNNARVVTTSEENASILNKKGRKKIIRYYNLIKLQFHFRSLKKSTGFSEYLPCCINTEIGVGPIVGIKYQLM